MNITNNINYHFTLDFNDYGLRNNSTIFTKKLLYNHLVKYKRSTKEGKIRVVSNPNKKHLKYDKDYIDIDLLVDLLIKYCSTNVDIMFKNYNYYQKPNFNLIKN